MNLLERSIRRRARYRYDPFGIILESSGPMAETFRFRFSTKYHEPVSGLVLYQKRAYCPELGRWLSRDPIGEDGGLNLYAFCGNNPVDNFDVLGLACGWAVGVCKRNLILPQVPSEIAYTRKVLGKDVRLRMVVPTWVQQKINNTRLTHHDVKLVAYNKKCTGGVSNGEEVDFQTVGFFAKDVRQAVYEQALDLLGESMAGGWVPGKVVMFPADVGKCNLSCISKERYEEISRRIRFVKPTFYNLSQYNCQSFAKEILK